MKFVSICLELDGVPRTFPACLLSFDGYRAEFQLPDRSLICNWEDGGWQAEGCKVISVRKLTQEQYVSRLEIVRKAQQLFSSLKAQPEDVRIAIINALRLELHAISPFNREPVDCVLWVKASEVRANDYNPNSVAPPEMKLLEHSITEDGYTQPIVSWRNNDRYEVVDGFHRNRVGTESSAVRQRVLGYLPLTVINAEREDRTDRIAATIRHNRARGKHQVQAMSDIVIELKRRNWSDDKIGNELGMDPDEVLRLTQITGLAEMFSDQEFSKSWDIDGLDSDVVLEDEE